MYTCQSEQVQNKEPVFKKDSVAAVTFNPPQLSDEYYRNLFKYQQNIILNPDSRDEKEEFITDAYFSKNKTLITFGCARRTNPKTNQPITQALIKRAALLDAKRWAAYGLQWIKNDFKPDFGEISEIYSGSTREVYSFDSGDSLVIALASEVR